MRPPPESVYCSHPGALSDPARDPAARLLLEADVDPQESSAGPRRLLLIEGGCGALIARFAPAFPEIICQNSVYPDHASAQATVEKLRLKHVACLLTDIPRAQGPLTGSFLEGPLASPCFPEGHFSHILFRLGRGTAFVNAALMQAFALLQPGGSLFACGHTREGIKSFAKRAEDLFGNASTLTLKSSCRLLRFTKTSGQPMAVLADPHYFQPVRLLLRLPPPKGPASEAPDASAIEYLSKPGIFSYRETDPATALLAQHLPACSGTSVLDFGCGSGVLSLAAFRLGAAAVTAVDMSAVAVACATRNFADHGVPGKAVCTYMTEGVTGPYDLIFSNPPFHQGAETDFGLPVKVLDALQPLLKPEGALYVVANHFLDYAKEGRRRFGKVEILARDKGYQIYRMT
jgi:16S rRNA (guanine1207-N2)-methyltransferase